MQLLYLVIDIPEELDTSSWSHKFRDWVRGLQTDYKSSEILIQNRLDQFELINFQIRKISTELRKYSKLNDLK